MGFGCAFWYLESLKRVVAKIVFETFSRFDEPSKYTDQHLLINLAILALDYFN